MRLGNEERASDIGVMSTAISLFKVSVVSSPLFLAYSSVLYCKGKNIVDHGSISSSTEHLGRVSDGVVVIHLLLGKMGWLDCVSMGHYSLCAEGEGNGRSVLL